MADGLALCRLGGCWTERGHSPKPHQAEYEAVIQEWEQVLRWSLEHQDEANADAARRQLAGLRRRLDEKHPPAVTREDRFWSRFEWPRAVLEPIASSLPGAAPAVESDDGGGIPSIVVPSQRAASLMDGTPSRIQREIWQDRLRKQAATDVEPNRTVLDRFDTILRAYRTGAMKYGCLVGKKPV